MTRLHAAPCPAAPRPAAPFPAPVRPSIAKRLALAGAALLLAGCHHVEAARDLVESRLASAVEGDVPALVRPLADRPLVEIGRYARHGSAWHRFEFARRLEYGIGLPRDGACAAFWYQRADQTPRPFGRDYATEPLVGGATGILQAQAAMRRLSADHSAAQALGPGQDAAAYGEAVSRCRALIAENPSFAPPPPPSW